MSSRSDTDELTGTDDLKFLWHKNFGARLVQTALAASDCRSKHSTRLLVP